MLAVTCLDGWKRFFWTETQKQTMSTQGPGCVKTVRVFPEYSHIGLNDFTAQDFWLLAILRLAWRYGPGSAVKSGF